MTNRPDLWNCSKKEWDDYLQTDEGKGDQKAWKLAEEQNINDTYK